MVPKLLSLFLKGFKNSDPNRISIKQTTAIILIILYIYIILKALSFLQKKKKKKKKKGETPGSEISSA